MTYFDSLFDTNSIGYSLILSVMNMRNLSFLIMIVTIVCLFSVGFLVVVVEYHGHFDIVLRGFEVDAAFSYKEAVKQLDKAGFDLVLTDLRLPDKDGIDLLRVIKEKMPKTQVLLMTGYADIQTAVTAIKLGAFDYVAKPVIPDEILKKLQEALKLEAEPVAKSVPAKAKPTSFSYIKGVSEGADRQYEYIHLVGPTMMTVLINGESGTGKEYIARLIHSMSNRKDGPFVAVDCGAIPKDLAASEFFGHIKGSFTGAVTDKQGYFVTASGGTIFLDDGYHACHRSGEGDRCF